MDEKQRTRRIVRPKILGAAEISNPAMLAQERWKLAKSTANPRLWLKILDASIESRVPSFGGLSYKNTRAAKDCRRLWFVVAPSDDVPPSVVARQKD